MENNEAQPGVVVVAEAGTAAERPWEAWTADTDVHAIVTAQAFRAVVHGLRHHRFLESMQKLFVDFPKVVTYMDDTEGHKGWNLLHYAALHSARREVVEYLAAKNPAALKELSADGFLPLHIAAQSGAAYATLIAITNAWRGALLLQTPEGDTPLHLAVAHATNSKNLDYLAAAEPSALKTVNNKGYVPFHAAVSRGAPPGVDLLPVVEALWELCPRALKAKTKDGALAFHLAAGYGTRNVCERLWEMYYLDRGPTVYMALDAVGAVPLHWAAEKNTVETVGLLAVRCPRSLQVTTTSEGLLPLHCAAMKNSVDVNQRLIDAYPDGLHATTEDGSRPLHLAASENKVEVVQLYVDQDFAGLQATTIEGLLPHHLAARRNSVDVNQRLIDAFPDGLRATADDGSYPLHLAAGENSPEVVKLLAEAFPQALQEANDEGLLPLHVAAEAYDVNAEEDLVGLNVIFYLATKSPQAFRLPAPQP